MNLQMFALRGIAATEEADSKAKADRLRSAIKVSLTAAGIDPGGLAKKPTAKFGDDDDHRALVVWYDAVHGAMRLFAPPIAEIDESTMLALQLLSGSFVHDLDALPIEDLDALCRLFCLLGASESVEDLYEAFIVPRRHRYARDFRAPTLEYLRDLWENFYPYYIGGTGFPPKPFASWITRAYAFGVGC